MISLAAYTVEQKKKETGRDVRITGRYGTVPWPPGSKTRDSHLGIDIGGLARGTKMQTYLAGEILYAGQIGHIGSYGYTLFLRPALFPEYVIQYAHAQELLVKTGDKAGRGQDIYTQGGSGAQGLNTYGVHTHMEIRKYEKNKKPWDMRKRLDPETPLFKLDHLKGVDMVDKLIVINSINDRGVGDLLEWKLKAPVIQLANASQSLLESAQTIVQVGGPKIKTRGQLVYLSGKDRYDTAQKVLDYLK